MKILWKRSTPCFIWMTKKEPVPTYAQSLLYGVAGEEEIGSRFEWLLEDRVQLAA